MTMIYLFKIDDFPVRKARVITKGYPDRARTWAMDLTVAGAGR